MGNVVHEYIRLATLAEKREQSFSLIGFRIIVKSWLIDLHSEGALFLKAGFDPVAHEADDLCVMEIKRVLLCPEPATDTSAYNKGREQPCRHI